MQTIPVRSMEIHEGMKNNVNGNYLDKTNLLVKINYNNVLGIIIIFAELNV